MVSILVVAVVLTNIISFNKFFKPDFADNSLVSVFLKHHATLNSKLYARNSTIRTTVAPVGLIPSAYADTTTDALTTDNPAEDASADTTNNQDDFISVTKDGNGTMIRPNPDSIAGLVEKQITIYETKPQDYTCYAVAAKFGISCKTIMWANHLTDVNLKPGWQLAISPVDGVIVKADSNTTLPDIARQYKVDLEKIIAYNGLANAEDIEKDQIIIVPGGIMPPPKAPKPKPSSPNTNNTSSSADGGGTIDNNSGGHSFPQGYCTWYVAQQVYVPWGGNAKSWLGNARTMGYKTGKTPEVGAIFSSNASRKYGHVGLVTSVSAKGFTIKEMNYEGFNKINSRFIPLDSSEIVGFIYVK